MSSPSMQRRADRLDTDPVRVLVDEIDEAIGPNDRLAPSPATAALDVTVDDPAEE